MSGIHGLLAVLVRSCSPVTVMSFVVERTAWSGRLNDRARLPLQLASSQLRREEFERHLWERKLYMMGWQRLRLKTARCTRASAMTKICIVLDCTLLLWPQPRCARRKLGSQHSLFSRPKCSRRVPSGTIWRGGKARADRLVH